MTQNAANQAAGNVAQTFISGLIQRAIVNPEQAAEVLTSGAKAVLSLTSEVVVAKQEKGKSVQKEETEKKIKNKKEGKQKENVNQNGENLAIKIDLKLYYYYFNI